MVVFLHILSVFRALLFGKDDIFDQKPVSHLTLLHRAVIVIPDIAVKGKAHRDVVVVFKDPVAVIGVDLLISDKSALILDRLRRFYKGILNVIAGREKGPGTDSVDRKRGFYRPYHSDLPVECKNGRIDRALKAVDRGISPHHLVVRGRPVRLHVVAAVADDLEAVYRYGTPGDATALKDKLTEAKAFLAEALTGYADGAVGLLRDEVNLSELEVARGRASQTLLDLRLKNLTEALATAHKTSGFTMATPTSFVAEGHGFRHPGGMVTEEDFVRARKALADGDTRITRAYQILCDNPYSQSDCLTWPVWEIIRGGGSGQNYINAARGAAIAYQNALRWKLSGDDAFAANGVRALMNWARNNRWVGGDTNKSLAAGLYGYGFAQAAEILREYEGWSRDDFEEFKRYMLVTWYPTALDFLRRRHDTWANFRYNVGERPGHYWSNWGLCNALCLMSIGILCDDVHIYNQGVSFYKYDHVGTFKPDRTGLSQILNDGCNEFIGNLVPVMMPDDRGPLGYLGQMQESGRDQGHALMALGLAVRNSVAASTLFEAFRIWPLY